VSDFKPENFLILVVDDMTQNLQILMSILEKVGYNISFALSGKQTLERLTKVKPDLILLDLMMPDLDGLEVCKRLKVNPDWCDIPVIFLTASHEPDKLLEAFEKGAVDYVTKPFKTAELLARVKTHLELKQTRDELKNMTEELEIARDSALELSNLKSQFLANMSHEIRTPMNGVLGMTDLLLNTELNQQQRDYLKILRGSGEDLLKLIEDILEISKLEMGATKLSYTSFDLRELLKEISLKFEPQVNQKSLDFSFVIEEEIPPEIIGDRFYLDKILSNLIDNSIKFTSQGHIFVKLSNKISPVKQEIISDDKTIISDDNLMIMVEDTGIGIGKEYQDKIFKSFSQGDSSNTRKYDGTGLGLAICKHLVNLMKGEISYQSIQGKGSTFFLEIPMAIEEKYQKYQQIIPTDILINQDNINIVKTKKNESKSELIIDKNIHILVVEDSIINRKVLVHQLQLMGYTVNSADNGEEALAQIEKLNYDLIFMDCQMPVLDGYDATTKIRQIQKEKKSIIIGLTANVLQSDRQKGLDVGMDDYLNKPISVESLREVLNKWTRVNP
jgi:two-component system, sensor histidine kinase